MIPFCMQTSCIGSQSELFLFRQCVRPGGYRVLGPDMHDWIRYQPPIVTPSHYYDSQRTIDLRQRVKRAEEQARMAKEHASTANQQMLEMAFIQRQNAVLIEQLEIVRALKEVVSRFALSTRFGGDGSVFALYIYIYLLVL